MKTFPLSTAMARLTTIFLITSSFLLHPSSLLSQGFNYQAVVRGGDNLPLASQNVGFRFSILNAAQAAVYTETQNTSTNALGMVSLVIGEADPVSFASIPWSAGGYSLKVEMDPAGGTSYTLSETRPLQSIPYALFAHSGNEGPQGPKGDKGDPGTGLTNRGNWASGTTYDPGDYVFNRSTDDPLVNSMWILEGEEPYLSTTQPYLDPAHWVEFQAPQGPEGPQGLQGIQGPEGPQGPPGDPATDDQELIIAGDQLSITGGNTITLPDADPANELQTLNISGSQLSISNGNTVELPEGAYLWQQSGGNIHYTGGNVGIGNASPAGKLEIQGDAAQNDEVALFEVKRKDGQTVFAVYPDGVRVYVEDPPGKGSKGGFAVGGFDPTKGLTSEFLRVTPDSVRIYVAGENDKGPKGGFAVGGFDPHKGAKSEILRVTPDSVRVYVAGDSDKGPKGGFAVGGFNPAKGAGDEYFRVTPDSVRIYIEEGGSKGPKGGFAVGGFNPAKGLTDDYLNVSGKSAADVYAGVPRVLWYPLKEAFLAGNVLVQHPDSVGTNSWASGYRSKAIGDWSQALGYQAIARGDYSTAIGKNAVANEINSFAFGEGASAKNEESYAFGRGAIAEGFRSFAFGSAGVDSAGQVTGVAYAKGDYSFAIGQGSISEGIGSVALGLADTAFGDYSLALGYKNSSTNWGATSIGINSLSTGYSSIAIGRECLADGHFTVAIGYNAKVNERGGIAIGERAETGGGIAIGNTQSPEGGIAIGNSSIASEVLDIAIGASFASGGASKALGFSNFATGFFSSSLGVYTVSQAHSSTVVGSCNLISGNSTAWVDTDPIFVIGNGRNQSSRSNAVTVLKNGNVGIGTTSPTRHLEVHSTAISSANVVHAQTNYSGEVDIRAFYGTSIPAVGFGKGGEFRGGKYGVHGIASSGTSSSSSYGVYGEANGGGNASRFGGRFSANTGSTTNYGIYATAAWGTTNYAGYFAGNVHVTGTFTNPSDIAMKKNTSAMKNSLEKILKMQPQTYEYKNNEFSFLNMPKGRQYGLIAQELEALFPELVFEEYHPASDSDLEGEKHVELRYKSINYLGLIPVLIKGMQEQQQIIKNQQSQINELKSLVDELVNR